MRGRLWRVLRWVFYPLFYITCLLFFAYLSFPFDALKGRIIAEFDRAQARQTRRPGEQPMRLSIAELDGYWLSGVRVERARLLVPPKPKSPAAGSGMGMGMGGSLDAASDEPAGPSAIDIESATVRVRLLPLLTGTVKIDLHVQVFSGEIEGTVPYGPGGDVDIELRGLQLGQVEPLRGMLQGMPLQGVVSGSVQIAPVEGKFAKANGTLDLRISNVLLGDGKAKLQGVALPPADGGQLAVVATLKDGLLKVTELGSKGKHLEVEGDGSVRLRESYKQARADLYLAFRFTDEYRDLNDTTRGLLGRPGDKFPPAIELGGRANPLTRAKRDDGFYQFHLAGALGDLDVNPASRRRGARTAPGATPGAAPGTKMPRLGQGASRSLRRPAAKAADEAVEPAPEADDPTPGGGGESNGDGDGDE